MYEDRNYNNAFWQMYMVFAIGCIVFFFFGVCALLCCCRKRFRGMERKGYVIREPEPREPLLQPTLPRTDPGFAVVTGPPYPVPQPQYQPPGYPTAFSDNPPQAPPAYDLPPKY